MTQELPFISFIIPVRNQCRDLTLLIFEIYKHFESRGETFEIIVADDASKDQTVHVLDKLAREFKTISLVSSSKQRGSGVVAREAILKSRGTFDVIIRPGTSMEMIDLLFKDLPQPFSGVLIGDFKLRSSLWPPSLFRLFLWQSFHLAIGRFVPGGVSLRLGPILFSREVAEETARIGKVANGGFEFELVHLAKHKGRRIDLFRPTDAFYVGPMPFFYFLTVVKVLVKSSVRFFRHRLPANPLVVVE